MSKASLLKLVALLIAASVLITGCSQDKKSVVTSAGVSVASDPPLSVRSDPLVYDTGNPETWFRHDLTVENSGEQAIVVDNLSESSIFLADGAMLASNGCQYVKPSKDRPSPSVACTASARAPFTVAPHASSPLTTTYVSKGLDGMSSLQPGKYVWNRELTWHYAGGSEVNKTHVAVTYTIS